MACCAILLDAKAAGKLTDDRPPIVGIRKTYDELETLMARLREQYKDKAPRHYTIADTDEIELADRLTNELAEGDSVAVAADPIRPSWEEPDPALHDRAVCSLDGCTRPQEAIERVPRRSGAV